MIMGGKNKLVLCATASHLLAGIWRAGKLQTHQIFMNDDAGHQAFSVFLAQFPATPVYLIADAVEEDYRLESVPHTTGAANRELIDRKLNQFYRGLVYRTAHFVTRESDKRKDDRYLFVALNNDDFLQSWIEAIQSVEVQLVGIYLLPMLSQVLVQQLKLTAPHILLCEKSSSGLRQTYLHNGSMRLSRLAPNMPSEASHLGYFYLEEIEKTRLYLVSQRFIARETPISLMLVSADGSLQEISKGISQESGLECSDVNVSMFANKLGLSASLIQKMPELLQMQLLANGHLVDNLAPAPLTKQYQFGKIKRSISIATVALGVLGLAVSAWVFEQGLDHKYALNEAKLDTLIQQQRYDEVAKNFPVTPISAADLKTAVELDRHIASYPKSPRRMMQVVSAALEQSPQTPQVKLDNVQLNRLHWVLTSDINVKDDDKFITSPVSAASLQANASQNVSNDPSKLNEIGFLNAEIVNFNGDYRGALNTVNRFVSNLKTDKRVAAVEVMQEPVNMSSYADLQGSTTDEQSDQKQPALFKLKIILKAPEAVEVKQP
ncbi:hypothetical protein GALL_256290 [mine drainage metagenome]|uniref:Uncharacterized protein n=1 Tax=mine drainage metagenome TaxID=410659 RepID=A0A1J5R8R4_9ZZZZ